MSFVLGRDDDSDTGPVGRLGRYRALDGSNGAAIDVDFDRPHAAVIVGKRGYGKSYTMGVLAEELARASGVAPVIVDPMGTFRTVAGRADGRGTDRLPATVLTEPTVAPTALDPRSWCALLGLSPDGAVGGLLWRATEQAETLDDMRDHVTASDAPAPDVRAALNHLELASSWDVFDADGLEAADLAGNELTVVDCAGLRDAPMNAVCRGVAETLYRARLEGQIGRLPWLLLDEAHAFFAGVAGPALEQILTRGRAPGVSLVVATQRPRAVPDVCLSQSDLLIAHRLTAQPDLEALARAQPSYMTGSLTDPERLPEAPGDVLVVDDATETVHVAHVRSRDTPHGGDSPRASEVDL